MRAAGGVFVGSIVIWAISCQSALKFCRPNDTQFPGVAPGQLRRAGNECGVKSPFSTPAAFACEEASSSFTSTSVKLARKDENKSAKKPVASDCE